MAKKTFLLSVDADLLKWVREQSQKDNRSITNWIVTQLAQLKESEGAKQQKAH